MEFGLAGPTGTNPEERHPVLGRLGQKRRPGTPWEFSELTKKELKHHQYTLVFFES